MHWLDAISFKHWPLAHIWVCASLWTYELCLHRGKASSSLKLLRWGDEFDLSLYRCNILVYRRASAPTEVLTPTTQTHTHITHISIILSLHPSCRGEPDRVSCLLMFEHFVPHSPSVWKDKRDCFLLDGWQWPWRRRRQPLVYKRESETLHEPRRHIRKQKHRRDETQWNSLLSIWEKGERENTAIAECTAVQEPLITSDHHHFLIFSSWLNTENGWLKMHPPKIVFKRLNVRQAEKLTLWFG